MAGHLTPNQYQQLMELHDTFFRINDERSDNYFYYMRTAASTAFQRILARGRAEETEMAISRDYVDRIHKLHDDEYLDKPVTWLASEMDGSVDIESKTQHFINLIHEQLHIAQKFSPEKKKR